MKSRQDQTDSLFVVRLNSGFATFSEISLESTVTETFDHGQNVTSGVTGVKWIFLAA